MRKTFVLLLVTAVGVWGYVVVQFLSAYFGKSSGSTGHSMAMSGERLPAAGLRAKSRAVLDTTFRDPFQSYLYAAKPAPVQAPHAPGPARPALKVIEPPTAVLNGILWGDAPVAILKQDGQTELVKEGAEVFGLKVVRIERHQVTVTKQGRKFTLSY